MVCSSYMEDIFQTITGFLIAFVPLWIFLMRRRNRRAAAATEREQQRESTPIMEDAEDEDSEATYPISFETDPVSGAQYLRTPSTVHSVFDDEEEDEMDDSESIPSPTAPQFPREEYTLRESRAEGDTSPATIVEDSEAEEGERAEPSTSNQSNTMSMRHVINIIEDNPAAAIVLTEILSPCRAHNPWQG